MPPTVNQGKKDKPTPYEHQEFPKYMFRPGADGQMRKKLIAAGSAALKEFQQAKAEGWTESPADHAESLPLDPDVAIAQLEGQVKELEAKNRKADETIAVLQGSLSDAADREVALLQQLEELGIEPVDVAAEEVGEEVAAPTSSIEREAAKLKPAKTPKPHKAGK